MIQFHGSYSDRLNAPGHAFLKLASRVLLSACDAVLVLSHQEKDEWSTFCPTGHFHVVSNPFTPEFVGPLAAASGGHAAGGSTSTRLRWPSGVPTLLFVGRLMPEKGIFDLVRAVAQVPASTPCRLLVAGDGPSALALARTVDKLDIADRVDLLGYASGLDLERCYREADVFVLPTYWAEGFPTVLLEAMSAGLPIVTTRLRGAADRLKEGVNALFVPPQRIDTLAEALIRILSDDPLRASMAANNRAKVREFAPDVVAPQYLAILQGVVEETEARRRRRAEKAS